MPLPSFYCENCGREVSSRLDSCPGCGEKFYSVRCPSCGFTGDSRLFGHSCPGCGYIGTDIIETVTDRDLHGSKTALEEFPGMEKNGEKFSPWIYKLSIAVLTVILIILIRFYFLL